ncbi:MAG TPA: hypothetical protein VLE70_00610 [Anaerolineae bacterium]|nr:hypothetical protein [Anaerolineae bacterium]
MAQKCTLDVIVMFADRTRAPKPETATTRYHKTLRLVAQQLSVLIFFVAATVIAGRDALSQLDSIVLGADNDAYINSWADWWTEKAFTDDQVDFWESDHLFYPQGAELYYHSFSHLNTAISLALARIWEPLAAYNLMILVNYVLAGFAMYQLMRYLTGSTTAGILAGIVFAFNSHNIYQSAHPVLLSVWILPLYPLGIIRGYREDRLIWPILAALMVFLGAAASTLILLILGIWTVPLVVYLWLTSSPRRPAMRNIVVFLCLSGLLLLPLLFPLLREMLQGNNTSFLRASSTSIPSDIFSPLVPPWYVWLRRGIYFGIVPVYLLIVVLGRRRQKAALWLLLLLGAFLFSIGPNPIFLGKTLSFSLPWSEAIVPLLRQTHRLNILVSFGLAGAVAYGWCAVREQITGKAPVPVVSLAFMVVLLIDYLAAPMPLMAVDVPDFYSQCLAGNPEEIAVAIIPSGRQIDKVHMYYQTLHGKRMTGGVISRHTGEEFAFLQSNELLRAGHTENWPTSLPADTSEPLRDLARRGIDLLVLEKGFLDVDAWREAILLAPAYEDDAVLVYDLRAIESGSNNAQDPCAWPKPITRSNGVIWPDGLS